MNDTDVSDMPTYMQGVHRTCLIGILGWLPSRGRFSADVGDSVARRPRKRVFRKRHKKHDRADSRLIGKIDLSRLVSGLTRRWEWTRAPEDFGALRRDLVSISAIYPGAVPQTQALRQDGRLYGW